MTKYAITVTNDSTQPRHFYFFTAPPQVEGIDDGNIFVNTWLEAWADPGEVIDVSTVLDFYAWCGPSAKNQGKTTISQGLPSPTPVTLGTASVKGSSYKTHWNEGTHHFGWAKDGIPNEANPGAYSIITDTFTPQDSLHIGMALKKNGSNRATPVAVIPADPNMRYNITPVVKFYVAVGDKQQNEIFHYTAESVSAGCYDFIGKGKGYFHGSISYTNQGTWDPTVYDNDLPLRILGAPTDAQSLVALPPWLQAIVDFTVPIVTQAVRDAIINAIRQQLSQISYTVGNFTFSSDGSKLTLSYRLPVLNASQAIVRPPRRIKPDSEVSVSLDAKNEILKITFSPQWFRCVELDSADSTDLAGQFETASLESAGVPAALSKAVNTALNSVQSKLPPGERWNISS
ncbi:hypothetical protein AOL_s00006g562 [Orbilia oligospora ATCC 24927]|uniref:Uncharacterized protein n=1 Tax=Arthrobotrys oligospora (strain ATCC 24927 / CBS 115.81 / DSM 1491) TaxID=756982 RepID=G1X111_ARTOA|nr:hypothetical protein AOL_s00006g562 [Orbilia oligospora ATCC 24927]EGX53184.1 hypothetical protein AOL_s00006g562 [Orbilia oligospora ATCC 24927]